MNILTLTTMDRVKVVAAFKEALDTMGRTNDLIRKYNGKRGVIDEMKAAGIYDAEFIADEFVRVVNGDSQYSRRIRDFISDIGWIAEMKLIEEKR